MADTTYDIVCRAGETLSRLLTVTSDGGTTPMDLTGYTALMQVRKTHASSLVMLELGSESPKTGITISGVLGRLTIEVDETVTAALPAISAVYDLIITSPSGYVTRLLEGKFVVQAGVTRV